MSELEHVGGGVASRREAASHPPARSIFLRTALGKSGASDFRRVNRIRIALDDPRNPRSRDRDPRNWDGRERLLDLDLVANPRKLFATEDESAVDAVALSTHKQYPERHRGRVYGRLVVVGRELDLTEHLTARAEDPDASRLAAADPRPAPEMGARETNELGDRDPFGSLVDRPAEPDDQVDELVQHHHACAADVAVLDLGLGRVPDIPAGELERRLERIPLVAVGAALEGPLVDRDAHGAYPAESSGRRALLRDLQLFALAPHVLLQEHGAEFGEFVGPVFEHAQDRLPVGDLERDDARLARPGALECACRLVETRLAESARQLEHETIRHRHARHEHAFDATPELDWA